MPSTHSVALLAVLVVKAEPKALAMKKVVPVGTWAMMISFQSRARKGRKKTRCYCSKRGAVKPLRAQKKPPAGGSLLVMRDYAL
jgi:hypothetical protein